MKTAYHLVLHSLGIGCIAACIAIVATMGALDIHWSGWLSVAFFAVLAIGIAVGWFPWRGKPLRVMIKGFYVMSALALFGFGFSMKDPLRPELWMVLLPVAAAVILRIFIKIVTKGRNAPTVEIVPRRASADDPFFN